MSLGLKDMIRAAETGDANAQFNVGIVYGNRLNDTGGHDSEDNRAQAIRWLLLAAHQGLPRAQQKLAEIYADGPDTSDFHRQACAWFLVAATHLSGAQRERVQAGFDRIARRLTPEQISEAREFARRWTATPSPVGASSATG